MTDRTTREIAEEWVAMFSEPAAHGEECPVGGLVDGGVWYGSQFAIHSDPACTDRSGECDCDLDEDKAKIEAACDCSLGVILKISRALDAERAKVEEAKHERDVAECAAYERAKKLARYERVVEAAKAVSADQRNDSMLSFNLTQALEAAIAALEKP